MYRRLVGGLAWPFDVAGGAMVLLAESRNPDFHTQRHNVYVLDEFQSDDITGLLRRMHRLPSHRDGLCGGKTVIFVCPVVDKPVCTRCQFRRRVINCLLGVKGHGGKAGIHQQPQRVREIGVYRYIIVKCRRLKQPVRAVDADREKVSNGQNFFCPSLSHCFLQFISVHIADFRSGTDIFPCLMALFSC